MKYFWTDDETGEDSGDFNTEQEAIDDATEYAAESFMDGCTDPIRVTVYTTVKKLVLVNESRIRVNVFEPNENTNQCYCGPRHPCCY